MANDSETLGEIDPPGGDGDDEKIPLRTSGDVEREMAKVYRAARKGRITTGAGNGLIQMLTYIAKVKREVVADELQERMAQLERRQAEAEERSSAH